MLCLIFEIFVTLIEVLLVLAAIFSHRVVQKNQLPAAAIEEDVGEELKGQEAVGAIQYRLHDLEIATNSFSEDNKLGKGGYGVVYKGLLGGQIVAIKKLFGSSADLDFTNEASLLSSLKHENLIKLLGYCCEAGYYILVYEYASNGDLYNHLMDKNKCEALNWEMRFEIIKGFARGLSYLHRSENMIIHRDLKPANVLLDEYHSAKIADFGLSRAFDMNKTHKTTKQIAGTMGYIAPELFYKQHYSTRSDVYSFGQLVLETLAGCTIHRYAQVNQEALSHVVWKQWKEKRPLGEVIDSSLQDMCPQEQLMTCIMVGLLCVQHDPKKRPNMKLVLEMLNSRRPVAAPSIPAFWEDCYDLSTSIQSQSARQQDSSTSIQSQPPLAPKSAIHSKQKSRAIIGGKFPALTLAWWRRLRLKKYFFDDLEEHSDQLKRFSLQELQVATDDFSSRNFLRTGRFGMAYQGRLPDGSLVVVKRLWVKHNPRGELRFQTELQMISTGVHRNLLKVQGFCLTPKERFLVYPYMVNGSLASCLRERSENVPPLDWPKRRKIALGAARGLSFLHDHDNPKIIHGEVNAAHIFLDEDFEAVLGNFGFAKLMNYEDNLSSKAMCWVFSHVAPEYFQTGKTSEKTDVFGYGIMLLELITGRQSTDLASLANGDDVVLLYWVKELLREERLEDIVDPDLRNNSPEMVVEPLIQVALICTQASPVERPKMSNVVRMLEEGDGLAERWEEWQKFEKVQESYLYIDCIDSTDNLAAIELSGPR